MGEAAKKLYPTPAHEVADGFLEEIARLEKRLRLTQEAFERQLEKIKQAYYPLIEEFKAKLREKEAALKKFAKKARLDLFSEGERCELPHGALLLTLSMRVKRARGVLKKLEELGWEEAIVVSKKVNWDVLEQWPDEKLVACGTERVPKEEIEYELKEVGHDQA